METELKGEKGNLNTSRIPRRDVGKEMSETIEEEDENTNESVESGDEDFDRA